MPSLAVLTVVVFLSPVQDTLLLSEMPGTRGLVAQGEGGVTGSPPIPVAGSLGFASTFVDINADGYEDLIVGAPDLPIVPTSGSLDAAGHLYFIFGGPDAGLIGDDSDLSLLTLSGGVGLDMRGDAGDRLGTSVARAGDVNADGFQDVIVGAPGRGDEGGAYVVFGSPGFETLPTTLQISTLATGASAAFLQGVNADSQTGHSVSGDVDVNADGRSDVVLGAPFDSTMSLVQNGTASVVYGTTGLPFQATVDLGSLGAGGITTVHGTENFQLMGWSVAGVGRFDPVLPLTNGQTNLFLGDEVAIGAPGSSPGGKFSAGAVYVMRGTVAVTPPTSYTADQFGNDTLTAGILYVGDNAGDQAGFHVARANDMIFDGQFFDDLIITAPMSNGIGNANSGSIYVVAGNYLGPNPMGFDLGELGKGSPLFIGIHVQGAQTGDGLQGVYAVNAGDWNDDGVDDLLVGHPAAPVVVLPLFFLQGGRARLLDGRELFLAAGTVDLAVIGPEFKLLELGGEDHGALAGYGLSAGDFNGDGVFDMSIGAIGAASDPDPFDPTGVAFLQTGRTHVVYGPVMRVDDVSPAVSHFGGEEVTITAQNVVAEGAVVIVDSTPAVVTDVVEGTPGTVTFAPPSPEVFGALSDVTLNTKNGNVTVEDALQYTLLDVTTGPVPNTGIAGQAVDFTGEAFSTTADTGVSIGGFPAVITAVDGIAGTMTVELPSGPAIGVPLNVQVGNSNGNVLLPGAFMFGASISDITPTEGNQTSGVFDGSAPGPFQGDPALPVMLTVFLAVGPVTTDVVVEFGTDALGFRQGTVTDVTGDVVTVDLPPFLLGPADVTVDVRVTQDAETITSTEAFTYLASDYIEHTDDYAQAAFGPEPPRLLMAGPFSILSDVILISDRWAPETELAVLILGGTLLDPPQTFKGGPLGVELAIDTSVFFFPLPGAPGLTLPASIGGLDASSNGVSVYMQFIIMEESGPMTDFSFTNVLEAIVNF